MGELVKRKVLPEDLITVKCRDCREWLYVPTNRPGRRRATTLKPVAGRIDGWCYCEPCLTTPQQKPAVSSGWRGGPGGGRVDPRGVHPSYSNEGDPWQENAARAMEDAGNDS